MNFNKVIILDIPKLNRLSKEAKKHTDKTQVDMLEKLNDLYNKSILEVEQRCKRLPQITYPTILPVSEQKEAIKKLIETNQVTILAGETGSGKTTQLPKICLELGLSSRGMIGHTQPRRLAAQTIAQRVSEELNSPLGHAIGYQVRFNDKSDKHTLVKLMTDGILLSEIKHDPLLLRYQVIIIDEAHERSLNIDFLLGYLKRILPKRPDLKLIITSATIDVDLFSAHFNNAPSYHIRGRSYPIETYYLEENDSKEQEQLIVETVKDIINSDKGQGGHILTFLACERDIREAQAKLMKAGFQKSEIYPLYARLSKKEQHQVFHQTKARKIILSTNIAETSLTVPGVKYVIDTGLARVSRFNYRSKIQQLPIEYISKASANQRRGRCGREGPGTCFRLYTRERYELMKEDTEAEILRTNLANVLLMSLDLNIKSLESFPFLQKPDNRYIKSAYNVLNELKAVDQSDRLTSIGRRLAHLRIDPRLGRMIIASESLGNLSAVIVIATFLSIQDPREYPQDRQEQAKQQHARFKSSKQPSDFYSILSLWCYIQNQREAKSKSALKKQLMREYLNVLRIQEWQDLVIQLHNSLKKPYQELSVDELNMDLIHMGCLSGLLSHIGLKTEDKIYQGARNRKFLVFPGSELYRKPPTWIMAANLVETTRLYGRICAPFEPHWLDDLAQHLVKYQYSEPHWSKKHRQAMIYRTALLYGLPYKSKDKVPLSEIDKPLARELFIKDVLVTFSLGTYLKAIPGFWQKTLDHLSEIQLLEAKSRRLGLIKDDQALYELFESRLPQQIFDIKTFKHALKNNKQTLSEHFSFNLADLRQSHLQGDTGQQFPDYIEVNQHKLPLSYHFDPEACDDGVSVNIDISLLSQIKDDPFSYLVPGLLQEKCIALLKTLPKQIRKRISPIPDTVANLFLSSFYPEGHLIDWLCQKLKINKKILINRADFNTDKLDPYYQMNYKIVDQEGELLLQGRSLSIIKQKLKSDHQQALNPTDKQVTANLTYYQKWDFESLDQAFEVAELDKNDQLYPGLTLNESGASLKVFADQMMATMKTQESVRFFIKNDLLKDILYIKKGLFKSKHATLCLSREQVSKSELIDQLIELIIDYTFLENRAFRNKSDYQKAIADNKSKLLINAHRLEENLVQVITLKQEIYQLLSNLKQNYSKNVSDVELQLERLFPIHYMQIAKSAFVEYPRYLKAIKTRLQKMPSQLEKDAQIIGEISRFEKGLWDYIKLDHSLLVQYSELHHFRFMLEEMRVSAFDQGLKTKEKVSLKRLKKLWDAINIENFIL